MYYFYLYVTIFTSIMICLSKLSYLFISKEDMEVLIEQKLKPLYDFRDSLQVEAEVEPYEIKSKLVGIIVVIAFCVIPVLNIIGMFIITSNFISNLLFIKNKHIISKG